MRSNTERFQVFIPHRILNKTNAWQFFNATEKYVTELIDSYDNHFFRSELEKEFEYEEENKRQIMEGEN